MGNSAYGMQRFAYEQSVRRCGTLDHECVDEGKIPSGKSRWVMMNAIAVAIVESKVEAWKAWLSECMGPRRDEFEDFNERMGLTVHRAWLMQSRQGPLAIVVFDGPRAEDFLPRLAISQEPFDRWFRERICEFHSLDFTRPGVLPPAELFLDWQAFRPAEISG
jgi:hypothetical protein